MQPQATVRNHVLPASSGPSEGIRGNGVKCDIYVSFYFWVIKCKAMTLALNSATELYLISSVRVIEKSLVKQNKRYLNNNCAFL